MTIWFISDTHFSHGNILKFQTKVGSLVRPGFTDVDHMDETMIRLWNDRVMPNDIVYHLGDVIFGNAQRLAAIMTRLNGRKRLILGNHDNHIDVRDFRKYFQKITSLRHFGSDMTGCKVSFVACHYPLHMSSFRYDAAPNTFCVHGHIHEKVIADAAYLNVSVERTAYAPIDLKTVVDMLILNDAIRGQKQGG